MLARSRYSDLPNEAKSLTHLRGGPPPQRVVGALACPEIALPRSCGPISPMLETAEEINVARDHRRTVADGALPAGRSPHRWM